MFEVLEALEKLRSAHFSRCEYKSEADPLDWEASQGASAGIDASHRVCSLPTSCPSWQLLSGGHRSLAALCLALLWLFQGLQPPRLRKREDFSTFAQKWREVSLSLAVSSSIWIPLLQSFHHPAPRTHQSYLDRLHLELNLCYLARYFYPFWKINCK